MIEVMDPIAARVWELIEPRFGKSMAITSREIVSELRARGVYAGRPRVRAAIHDLIVEHGKNIASGQEGYWVTATLEERRRTCAHLGSRLREISRRLYSYDANAARELLGEIQQELSA